MSSGVKPLPSLTPNRTQSFLFCFSYAGRPCAASPATGSKMQHLKELAHLTDDALNVN